MGDQLAQFYVGHLGLPNLPREVDVVEHPFESDVLRFDPTQGLVQFVPDVFVGFVD